MPVPQDIRRRRQQERTLAGYEGLIYTTAKLVCERGVEMELEDVQQLLRIKAWKAIDRFNPELGLPLDRYVFMCVFDERKTIEKKKRRYESYLEDEAPAGGNDELTDSFTQRYLSVDGAAVYAEIEDELPELPITLSTRQRWVLTLLMRDYRQGEIAEALDISKREVESSVRSLRAKMADWRPAAPGTELEAVA